MEKIKIFDKDIFFKILLFLALVFLLPLLANESFRFFNKIGFFVYSKYFHLIDFVFVSAGSYVFFAKTKVKQHFYDFRLISLLIFLILLRLSLLYSPRVNSYKSYSELLKFVLSAGLFFFIFTNTFKQKKDLILKMFFAGVLLLSLINSFVALGQFFLQKSIGLYFLGENRLSIDMPGVALINIKGGGKWLLDSFFNHAISSDNVLRAHGLFFHPNILAGFLVMAIMITLYFLHIYKTKKLFLSGFLFIQFLALLTTFSRGGLFAVLIAGIIWFSLMLYKKQNVKWLLVVFSSIVIIGVTLLSNQLYQRGGVFNYNESNKSSDSVRTKQNSVALAIIKKEPLRGVGYKNFISSIKYYTKKEPYLDNVHNIYLLIAAENGLLAILAFFIFLFAAAVKFFKGSVNSSSITFFSIASSFLFIGLVDHYFVTREVGRLMFFAVLTVLVSSSNQEFLNSQKV